MLSTSIPVGPRNPSGVSAGEVLSALQAVDGFRRWEFRYELTDGDGVFVKELDTVQSGRIEYSTLADVKRTARFQIRDIGDIDFISDRIRPYARLVLPPYGDDDYVEWPLGVFVLASPTRSSDATGVVEREVIAYDRGQIYLDDLVDRYAVSATSTMDEGFEDADYRLSIWGDWSRNDDYASSGSWSMRSADIDNHGRSVLHVGVPPGASTLYFSYRVDSEESYDYFNVYVDGALSFSDSGFQDWANDSVSVSGASIVTFEYAKDYSFSTGDDAAWVDNLSFPDTQTRYIDAIADLLEDPEANIVACSATVSTPLEWDPGTPKLRIVNELLGAINYRSLWFDAHGVAQCAPYVEPADRSPEYVYADDAVSVMLPTVGQELDLYSVPNKWILYTSRPDATSLSATATNDDPASRTSTVRRGRIIARYVVVDDVADQATLDALAQRYMVEASSVYEKITFQTAIMPVHADADVYQVRFGALAIDAAYSETSWSMPLAAGGRMKHEARRAVRL
jgi:hypothetical protein